MDKKELSPKPFKPVVVKGWRPLDLEPDDEFYSYTHIAFPWAGEFTFCSIALEDWGQQEPAKSVTCPTCCQAIRETKALRVKLEENGGPNEIT